MRNRILVLAAAALLGGTGCSEDPTEQNSLVAALPLGDMIVRDTVIVPAGSTTARKTFSMNGRVNLLGRSEDFTASMALQFFPSLFPSRDTVLVVSATLRMLAVSWTGDPSGLLDVTVYRIDRSWSQSTLTWDSVQSGFYSTAVERGRFSGSVTADTQQIAIALDTSMAREWLRTPTSTTDTKYGVFLLPSPSSTVIRGFSSFDVADSVRPSLEIIATNVAGTTRDTSVFTLGADTFVGSLDFFAPDPARLTLQAGLPIRSTLRFDVSGIPRGAIVNAAELLLVRDPVASRLNRFSGDSLISGHVLLTDADTLFESDASSAIGGTKDGVALTHTLNLRHAVQSWLRGPNYGLLLRVSSATEFSSADRYVFYSPQAQDSSLHPRLRIVFATQRM